MTSLDPRIGAASLGSAKNSPGAAPAARSAAADFAGLLDIADDRKAAKAARNDPPRTAGELDAAQKGGGFVNTMAELSPAEKRLYDDLVAQGNWKAVEGLNLVALSRVGMTGREVTTPDGQSFFPSAQEVTADSLRSLFRHLIVDADGHAGGAFEALASYLDKKPVA